jgi:hypothetical protein
MAAEAVPFQAGFSRSHFSRAASKRSATFPRNLPRHPRNSDVAVGYSRSIFPEDIADPHHSRNLFRAEPRKQIPPNGLGMNRPCSRQRTLPEFGQLDENNTTPPILAINQLAFLHARELVREPAFVPPHRSGQVLLTHLPFADAVKPRQDSKICTGKSSAFRKILCNAAHHLVAHDLESVPYPKFLWRQKLAGHR